MHSVIYIWLIALSVIAYAILTIPKALELTGSPFALAQYLAMTWVAPFMLIALTNKERWVSTLFLFLYILSPEIYLGGRLLPVFFLVIWPLFLITLGQTAIHKKRLLPGFMISPYWLIYAAIALIAYVRTPVYTTIGTEGASGFRSYFIFFSTFLIFPLMPVIFSGRQAQDLPRHLFFLSLVVIVVKSLAFLFGHEYLNILLGVRPEEWLLEKRWTFLAHAGGFMLFSSLALMFAPNTRPKHFVMLALSGLVGLFTIMMTGTRTSVLAAGAVIICAAIMKRAWWLIGCVAGVIFTAALIISNIDINPASAWAPLLRSFTLPWLNFGGASTNLYATWETYDWRKGMWDYCMAKIAEKPFLGHGFFVDYSPLMAHYARFGHRFMFYELSWMSEIGSGATHNLWLGPFVNFGIAGGVLFILYAFERSIRTVRMLHLVDATNPYRVVTRFMALWLIYILAGSYTTGGTNATYFFLFAALSHLLEHKIAESKTLITKSMPQRAPHD